MLTTPTSRRERGVLEISNKTMSRIVEGSLARHARNVSRPKVRVATVLNDSVELSVAMTMEYPTEPLSRVLSALRGSVAPEIERLLGRSISRFDITVTDFVHPKRHLGPRVQ